MEKRGEDIGRGDQATGQAGGVPKRRAFYHPSCHALRGLGLRKEGEALLESVAGVERVEIEDAEECCGFGGLFALEMPEVSTEIMNTKLDRLEEGEVEMLVGADASCLMHLEGGLRRRRSAIQVLHIASALASGPPTAGRRSGIGPMSRPVTFRRRARRELSTSKPAAVGRAARRFTGQRQWAVDDFVAMEATRDRGRQIRLHTLANLHHYLDLFADSVKRAGGQVLWAADAAEANRMIGRLVGDDRNKLVIKSKSMVTEELELLPYLEGQGHTVVETDLGEFIVQIAGDHPSHIIAPVMHLTRQDVGALFQEQLGDAVHRRSVNSHADGPPTPAPLFSHRRRGHLGGEHGNSRDRVDHHHHQRGKRLADHRRSPDAHRGDGYGAAGSHLRRCGHHRGNPGPLGHGTAAQCLHQRGDWAAPGRGSRRTR